MDTPNIEPTNTTSLAGDPSSTVNGGTPPPLMGTQGNNTNGTGGAGASNSATPTPAPAPDPQGGGQNTPDTNIDEPLPPAPMQFKDPNAPTAPEPEVVPEQYEKFTVPAGYDMDATAVDELGSQFRELGFSQAKAQKIVDMHYQMIQKQEAAYQKQINDSARQWYNEIHARPDYATEKSLVDKGIAAVVKTPAQAELFKNPTFAYSPLIWDIFREVGKIVAEDSIGGTRAQSAPPVDDNPYHINL